MTVKQVRSNMSTEGTVSLPAQHLHIPLVHMVYAGAGDLIWGVWLAVLRTAWIAAAAVCDLATAHAVGRAHSANARLGGASEPYRHWRYHEGCSRGRWDALVTAKRGSLGLFVATTSGLGEGPSGCMYHPRWPTIAALLRAHISADHRTAVDSK